MWGTGLLKGMMISLRNWRRGPITLKYPYEKVELPERSRWAVRPKYFADGEPKCTACMTCVRTCPDYILDLDVETREDKSKHVNSFTYEVGACMMCGLCVESCPFDAIEMSHEYELATCDRSALKEKLLADVDAATSARHKAEKEAAAAAAESPATAAPTPADAEGESPISDAGAIGVQPESPGQGGDAS